MVWGETRPLNVAVALGALALGIALFCMVPLAAYHPDAHASFMGLFFFMFTPLFGIPLGLALWRDGRVLWWVALLYFVFWLTLVHYGATMLATGLYPQTCPFGAQRYLSTYEACLAEIAARKEHALKAGLGGGVVGAALSYLGLLAIGPSFRTPQALSVMAIGTLALGALGAYGLSATVPDEKSFVDYVVQLYVPWQAVFGGTLVWLFAQDVPRAK